MQVKKPTKALLRREFNDYLVITLGIMCYCFAWAAFLLPYQISTGGTTGISAIIFYATNIPTENTYFFINAVLMIFAVKILGPKFSIKTTYAIIVLTLTLKFFQWWINGPDGVPPLLLGEGQDFMACIIGAVMCGAGLGIVFSRNGSTGGTDIIAAVIHKYKDVSLGRMIMLCDVFIILSCYLVFHDWKRVIFGFVTLFIIGFVLDYIVNSARQSVQFFIFSKEYEKIADRITKETHRGVTVLDGTGWYSKGDVKVLVVLAYKRQSLDIFRLVKDTDPNAFMSQSSVIGVYGEGFDKLKGKTKKKFVFATNNAHKLEEVSVILKDKVELLSLKAINCETDIPETAETLEGNALIKARYIYEHYRQNCFADDTGLEVEALNGAPGVYSARYAGDAHNSEANMRKLLQELEGKENRKAQFRTVFALIIDGKEHLFEGIVKGKIALQPSGTSGFGYDPVFIPEGYTQTFAEMGNELKNKISHRALATKKLCKFLTA